MINFFLIMLFLQINMQNSSFFSMDGQKSSPKPSSKDNEN